MQRKYRSVIFYIFAILFFVSTPFVLLYANGYRYNAKKSKFEKTGGIIINTTTKNVSVSVENNFYGSKTEYRIKNLLPGEYNVKISKSGFFDWQKKLLVESQLSTFVKDVRLIQNSLPVNVVSATTTDMYASPDKTKFLYIKKEKNKNLISLYDTTSDTTKDIFSSQQPIINIFWSPNNDKIVLQTQNGFQMMNTNDAKTEELPLKTKITSLRWDESNGFLLFAKTADGIYKIDLLFGKAQKIYTPTKDINDFMAFQNYIYLATQSGLEQIDLNNNEMISIPLERAGYKINSIINKKIFLTDSKGHLQIFNLPLQKLSTPELLANAKDFDVLGNEILYYNDFELWVYNAGDGNKQLITRIGEELKKAEWLPGAEYIVFSLEKQIKIIETDERDARQIYSFPKFDEISDFMMNKKYSIYFSGKMNSVSGIYKLEI